MQIIHQVFFWLNEPDSKEDLQQLLKGLRTLENIETVKSAFFGVPAATEQRDVTDNSFSASETLFFDDLHAQDVYQSHPVHQKFIKDCSHLWSKVLVYDIEDLED
jgi:hypothetical protein